MAKKTAVKAPTTKRARKARTASESAAEVISARPATIRRASKHERDWSQAEKAPGWQPDSLDYINVTFGTYDDHGQEEFFLMPRNYVPHLSR